MKCVVTLNNGLDIHIGDVFWGYVLPNFGGGWGLYHNGTFVSYEQLLELKLVKLTIYRFNVSPMLGYVYLPFPGRELEYRIEIATEDFGSIRGMNACPEDFLTTLFPTKEEAEEAFAKLLNKKTQEYVDRLNQQAQAAMARLTGNKPTGIG